MPVVGATREQQPAQAPFARRDADDSERLLLACRERGDRRARERLVELYLPLVRALARRYVREGESLEDLVQVGALGLLEAIDRFDPERGHDLAAYALPTIKGQMKNHLRDRCAPVRVPRRLSQLRAELGPAQERLTTRLGRRPTVSELASDAGLGEAEVAEAIASNGARVPVSLESDETGEVADASTLEDAFALSNRRLLLAAAFRILAERERRILHLRFFRGLSQREIAVELGLSQIQVSRLIRSSLDRMRAALGEAQGS